MKLLGIFLMEGAYAPWVEEEVDGELIQGVTGVVASLKAHSGEIEIESLACVALQGYCKSNKGVDAFLDGSGVTVLLSSLRENMSHEIGTSLTLTLTLALALTLALTLTLTLTLMK